MKRNWHERISFESDPTWDPETEEKPSPFRLEHLPSAKANAPPGRGRDTAAGRGYDTEQLMQMIVNGTRDGPVWYDIRMDGSHVDVLTECKTCIAEYPCEQPGTFKIWKPHHEKLLEPYVGTDKTVTRYIFLIYTVHDGHAYEVGKVSAITERVDELIDDWRTETHETMGHTQSRELTWTRMTDAFNITFKDIREAKYATPNMSDSDEH